MKKLMIAVALVAMTATSQAAVYQWRVGNMTGHKIYKMNDTDVCASAPIYLFCTTDYSQDTLISALSASGLTNAQRVNILKGNSVDEGALATAGNMKTYKDVDNFGTETEGYAHNYLAVLTTVDGKDYLYVSADKPTMIPGDPDDLAQFSPGAQGASENAAYAFGSKFAGEGGKGAGWYTLQGGAVPEPTSGLLLLLGVAGLALRRRRA